MDKKTVSDKFLEDSRIAEGKKLILEALKEHQESVQGVREAKEELKQSYEELLEACSKARGGNLYYPYLGSGFGSGPLVELADGSVKYDFISGIGPNFWGHCNPEIVESSIDAALGDTIMQGHLQQNVNSFKLMESINKLAQMHGSKLEHCFLSTSGAMANENALKIIFQKNHPASRILCFKKCFSGRTMALAQMTDKAAYRMGIPNAMDVDYIPFYDAENPEESTAIAVKTLKDHITRFPGQYAAMCMELVQGEAGYYPGTKEFFMALIEVLKENNIAVWADEIQTFGRLGKPFAFQHFELDEHIDVVTIGKLSQICATLFTADFKPKPGLLSQTFTASNSAIAAAQVVMDRFLKGDLFGEEGRIAECFERFTSHIKMIEKDYPEHFSGPFGIGAMTAFTVFNGDMSKSVEYAKALYDAGVISFIAGSNPTRIRFLMPIACITNDDIDNACQIMRSTLESMIPDENQIKIA